MSISIHPEQGTILICDFKGFIDPEMNKRRPVVVMSPRLRQRGRLCAIVPLSTTPPSQIMPYHHKLHVDPVLPAPYDAKFHWVKADMIYTVSFDRLFLPFDGKDAAGKRIYDVRVIDKADLIKIQHCILHSLGLTLLTDYL
ncbi:MAG: type II toxin-antitoxin system PemK/MazF family toxin [Methylobacter sp.]